MRPCPAGGGSRWVVAARRREADGRGQTKVLLSMVDDMLEEEGVLPGSLGAVVVGTGPGTFTGVRITVATGRALGLALSLPVLGVSTLSALAADVAAAASEDLAVAAGATLLMPLVDAHRGQVFYGLYRRVGQVGAAHSGSWVRSAEFGVCDREKVGSVVTAATLGSSPWSPVALVVGESSGLAPGLGGPMVFREIDLGAESLVLGQEVLQEPGCLPQGARLAPWLAGVLRSGGGAPAPDAAVGGVGTPESVVPIYVRAPDADIHITKMRDPWADVSGER